MFFWSSASAECRSSRKRRCLITPAKNSLFQSLTQFYVSNEQIVDLVLSHHGCATPHALWRWPSDANSIDVIGRWRGGMFFICCRREFRTDRSRKSILSRSIVLYWLNTGVIWSVQPRLFLFSSLSISRLRPVSSDTRAYVRLLLCSTASWSGHHFMNRHDLDGNRRVEVARTVSLLWPFTNKQQQMIYFTLSFQMITKTYVIIGAMYWQHLHKINAWGSPEKK